MSICARCEQVGTRNPTSEGACLSVHRRISSDEARHIHGLSYLDETPVNRVKAANDEMLKITTKMSGSESKRQVPCPELQGQGQHLCIYLCIQSVRLLDFCMLSTNSRCTSAARVLSRWVFVCVCLSVFFAFFISFLSFFLSFFLPSFLLLFLSFRVSVSLSFFLPLRDRSDRQTD